MLSPVVVPRPVHQGLVKVKGKGVNMINILQVMEESIALGHVETAAWIDSNIRPYIAGLTKGFTTDTVGA